MREETEKMERCARPFCGHMRSHHKKSSDKTRSAHCYYGWEDESGAMPCDCDRYVSPDHARAMADLSGFRR